MNSRSVLPGDGFVSGCAFPSHPNRCTGASSQARPPPLKSALWQPRKHTRSDTLASASSARRTPSPISRKHCLEASESHKGYAAVVVDHSTEASTKSRVGAPGRTSLLGVANPISDTDFVGSSRIKIAVDVDEVLGRFVESLNEFYHATFDEQYDVSDFHEYCFRKVWNCTQDESNDIVHAFFRSHHFSEGIQPIPGAYEALLHLSHHVDLEVVTSRQNAIQAETVEWIHAHFPDIFQDIHFGNHWAKEGESIPKSEICKRIGASCLIDDNPAYAMECAENGIDVLLYDWNLAYPWSKTEEGPVHERIQRVHNWDEAAVAIMAMVSANRN